MIYLASPFRHRNPETVQRRINMNRLFVNHLIAVQGAYIYAPLLYGPNVTSPGVKIPEKYWLAHCVEMLKKCDALYVYCLPGWDKSKGVALEIETARAADIPITFYNEFFEPCA